MTWITAMAIMVSSVLVNHLGLISAIEMVIGRVVKHEVRLPVVGCGKCLTFWASVVFVAIQSQQTGLPLWSAIAIPPLMSYAAWWMALLLGYLDSLYNKAYDAIYPDPGLASVEPLSAARQGGTNAGAAHRPLDAVPDVW